MGKLSLHVERPPPFAYVTPDQQVQPFGTFLAPKQAHPYPFNLRVDDIPGAKPREHCFATPPRLTNPLEPQYQLPHSEHLQPAPPVPRFIRNAMDNSDILGAQAAHRDTSKHHTHNFRLDCSDVEGAAPGWQPDWKLAAKARHSLHRPATAPVQRQPARPTRGGRPTNYLGDIEKSSPSHPSNADAHQAKVQAANAAAGRSCAAQQLLQQRVRTADSAAVSSLWRNFRKCDREASGKLSSSEFAAALQSSKLGFSSAEVLQVANGLADSDGLLDYRPVGRMLRSQGSGNPALQGVNSAEAGAKKPPLPRPSSSKAERSNRVAQSDQTAANDDHAAQRRTPSAAPAAASSTVQVQQHGSDAGLGHSPTTGGWSEPMQAEAEHQQAAQSVACAAVQPAPNRATLAGSKAGSDSLSGAKRPGTAPCKKAAGPPAQKVSYFFSKGQIDMQQPYEWKPSKDDTAIQDAASRGVYVRSWSTGHTRNKPLQDIQRQQAQEVAVPVGIGGSKGTTSFHNDSPVYRRPVHAVAAVDISHRDSPETRRQKSSLLEDMMTIRRL
ncbi:hypothetical protein ABBQ32_001618 [Trebouxia sp. C0010 RCD-2024]